MTATETYQARRQEIDAQLSRIQTLLNEWDMRQKGEQSNWGFAGSAGHIKAQLAEVITHLSKEEE